MCRNEIYTLELTIMIRATHLHTLLCCDVQIFFSGLFPKKSITKHPMGYEIAGNFKIAFHYHLFVCYSFPLSVHIGL